MPSWNDSMSTCGWGRAIGLRLGKSNRSPDRCRLSKIRPESIAMIFPFAPKSTETRRVDDVNVRATPAVTGITAAHGFNQPGVVVTIGDGARTLARSGQQPQSGNSEQGPRVSGAAEESTSENVFGGQESKTSVEAVFNDKQGRTLKATQEESERLAVDESERLAVEEDGAFGIRLGIGSTTG